MMRSATCVHAAVIRRILDEHRELVTAESRHGIRRAHAGEQSPGGFDQQRVPGAVPQAVVDGLEVVEIQEQQRERRLAATLRPGQGVLRTVAQQRAVRESRQRVVERLMGELGLERGPLAHVARVEHDAPHRLVVQQAHTNALDRAPCAIAVPHPPLERHQCARPRHGTLQEDLDCRHVIGMRQLRQRDAFELRRLVAEQTRDRRALVDHAMRGIHDRHEIGRVLHQRPEPRVLADALGHEPPVIARGDDLAPDHQRGQPERTEDDLPQVLAPDLA